MQDTRLIEEIANGNELALEELYNRYARVIYSLLVSIVKKEDLGEELLQEFFLRIWERADNYDRSKGAVYTWMVTLARNMAIDCIRSKDYRNQQKNIPDEDELVLGNLESDQQSPMETLLNAEKAATVRKALEQIPEEQKKVIQITLFQGLTQSEIAEQYEIPLGTVKTRMRQGMLKLNSLLSNKQGSTT